MPTLIDITGQRFGRLVALRTAPRAGRDRGTRWLFACDCGRECVAASGHVRRGATSSCGCLQRELASERARTHGLTDTREYRAWAGMRTRCTNPRRANFKDYGGRGITYAPAWDDFETFLRDLGPSPGAGYSLERKDNEHGYEPGNVVWATRTKQNRNKRSNRMVEYQGQFVSLAEAAERAGIAYWTVHARLRSGWTHARALSEPVHASPQWEGRRAV